MRDKILKEICLLWINLNIYKITLKKCKNKLKESYGDDWQDFVKEDFYKLNKQYG